VEYSPGRSVASSVSEELFSGAETIRRAFIEDAGRGIVRVNVDPGLVWKQLVNLEGEAAAPTDSHERTAWPGEGASPGSTRFPLYDCLALVMEEAWRLSRGELGRQHALPSWPGDKLMALTLTHDVDVIDGYPKWQRLAKSMVVGIQNLIRGRVDMATGEWVRAIQWGVLGKDPFATVPDVLEDDRRLGVNSTFFFLSAAQRGERRDCSYGLGEPYARKCIRGVRDGGMEVGLHGSYRGFDNVKELQDQRLRLEQVLERPVGTYRNHFLRFRPRTSFALLAEAGFRVDSTVGWSPGNGFRAGTCFPFVTWSSGKKEASNLVEVPLIIMEGNLDPRERFATGEDLLGKSCRFIDEVRRFGGVLNVVWHNDRWYHERWPGFVPAYVKLVDMMRPEAWFCTLRDVAAVWEKRFRETVTVKA